VDVASWLFIGAVVVFTLTAAVTDFRTKKIPNRLTVPAFAAALVYHGAVGAWTGGWGGFGAALLTSLGGFGVGFGILLLLWLIGGGGAGDVKLMGAIGAWLGPWNTLVVFFVSTIFVIVMSAAFLGYQLIAKGMTKTKSRYMSAEGNAKSSRGLSAEDAATNRKVRRRLLPFGVPVALATWVVLVWSFREQLFTH
jgi:prepilin peptidase CpaA